MPVDYFAVETFFSNPVIAPIKKQPAQTLPLYELKITLRGSNPANVLGITGDCIQTIYNMIVQGDRTWDYAAL